MRVLPIAHVVVLALLLLAACTHPPGPQAGRVDELHTRPAEAVHRPPRKSVLRRSGMSSEFDGEGERLDLQDLSVVVPVDDSRSTSCHIVVDGFGAEIDCHREKLVTAEFSGEIRRKLGPGSAPLVHATVAGPDCTPILSPFSGGFHGDGWRLQCSTAIPEAP